MATWFTVIGRIAQIEGISDSNYKNALVEFEEGDSAEKEPSSWRSFYVAFWGDLLDSGRSYIIFGSGRLKLVVRKPLSDRGSLVQRPKTRTGTCFKGLRRIALILCCYIDLNQIVPYFPSLSHAATGQVLRLQHHL
jgi:hypothetical protein